MILQNFVSNVHTAPDYVCNNCDWPVYVHKMAGSDNLHVYCPCGEVALGEGVMEDFKAALIEGRVTLEEVF